MTRRRTRLAALRRARTELATARVLLDLSRALADATTSDDAAHRLAAAIPAVTGSDRASVLLLDGDGRFVVRGVAGHEGPTVADLERLSFTPEQFGVGLDDLPPAVVCRVEDAPADVREAMTQFATEALAVVAVRVRDKVRALLTADWIDAARLPSDAVLGPRLRALADQSASAFTSAALLDDVRHQALHDGLTGLPNHTLFADRTRHAIARARRRGDRLAVGVLDLDRFKTVNDSLGHQAGDDLLVQVAARLRAAVRQLDTVARIGGDEFTLLLPELDAHGEAIVAERLLAAFERPFDVEGHRIRMSPSIGLAVFPSDGDTPERLQRSADAAMYRAKDNGRNTWAAYASGMNERAYDRLTLETDLHRAVERRELRLGFQPLVRLADREQVGAEALVRWAHPSFGILESGEFVPLADEAGLVAGIDAWALGQACRELGRSDASGARVETVAVNLSARSLTHPSLPRLVTECLTAGGISADRLVVEVGESVLAGRADGLLEGLRDLRSRGVRITVDGFGRAHAPLADLRDLPIDTLKLDRSFLARVRGADDDTPVLANVVAMAHDLGLDVVAVGVDTEEQLALVHRLGCDLAQGNLLGRATAAIYDGARSSTA